MVVIIAEKYTAYKRTEGQLIQNSDFVTIIFFVKKINGNIKNVGMPPV